VVVLQDGVTTHPHAAHEPRNDTMWLAAWLPTMPGAGTSVASEHESLMKVA
jgi:hypothetical protein